MFYCLRVVLWGLLFSSSFRESRGGYDNVYLSHKHGEYYLQACCFDEPFAARSSVETAESVI